MASKASGETREEKQLRIKSGSVRRLNKEYEAYKAEASEQKKKVETMIASGMDEYDIKKQNEVLAETEMMIPDTLKRFKRALADLEAYIDSNADALASASGLAAAQELVAQFSEATPGAAGGGAEEEI